MRPSSRTHLIERKTRHEWPREDVPSAGSQHAEDLAVRDNHRHHAVARRHDVEAGIGKERFSRSSCRTPFANEPGLNAAPNIPSRCSQA
jgi:hypothetical protein